MAPGQAQRLADSLEFAAMAAQYESAAVWPPEGQAFHPRVEVGWLSGPKPMACAERPMDMGLPIPAAAATGEGARLD
jgi:hypothetical protein